MPRLNRPLMPWEIAARRRNAQKSTGPRTPAGKRRASLNSLKWPLWPARMRATVAKSGAPPREYRRLTRDLTALLDPCDAHLNHLVCYLVHHWWLKAIQVGIMRRHPRVRLDTTGLDQCLEFDLASFADGLSFYSRKWLHRLEKSLGARVESFADLRAKIESRLATFQDGRSEAEWNLAEMRRSATEIVEKTKGSLIPAGKAPI